MIFAVHSALLKRNHLIIKGFKNPESTPCWLNNHLYVETGHILLTLCCKVHVLACFDCRNVMLSANVKL